MYLVREKTNEFLTEQKHVDLTVFKTLAAATGYAMEWLKAREGQNDKMVGYESKERHKYCIRIGFWCQSTNGDYEEITIENVCEGDPE